MADLRERSERVLAGKFRVLSLALNELVAGRDVFGLDLPRPAVNAAPTEREFASTQLDVTEYAVLRAWREARDALDPADVVKYEDRPHITVLFGLHDDGPTANVFCPTGPGGGVNPTCSPGGRGAAGGNPIIESALKKLDAAPIKSPTIRPPEPSPTTLDDNAVKKFVVGKKAAMRFGREETVSADELIATQTYINSDKVRELIRKGPEGLQSVKEELPIVIRQGGKSYAGDGHHRIEALKLLDRPTFKALVIDVDEDGRPSTKLANNAAPLYSRVAAVATGTGPVRLFVGGLSLFRSAEYDVLKFDVTPGRDLVRLRELLSALPNTQTYPEYRPHLTVAYLKPGTGAKYLGLPPANLSFTADRLTFSGRDRSERFINLLHPTANFDPHQPRDREGQWTSGGGSGNEWVGRLEKSDPEAARSLRWYTGTGSEAVNKYLRGGKKDEEMDEAVAAIDRALESAPKHVGVVYRGLRLDNREHEAFIESARNSGTVTDPAYASSSVGEGRAAKHAFRDGIVLKIHSKTGRNVEAVSQESYEEEILFPRGTKFRVRSVREDGERTVIEVDEGGPTANFDPRQPRDDEGQWTSGGSGRKSAPSSEGKQGAGGSGDTPSPQELEGGERTSIKPGVDRVKTKAGEFAVKARSAIPGGPETEQAVSDLAADAGVSMPRSRVMKVGGKDAVVTPWVDGTPLAKMSKEERRAALGKVPKEQIDRHALFDYAVGHGDVHNGNYILGKDGNLHAIDKEMALTTGGLGANTHFEAPRFLDDVEPRGAGLNHKFDPATVRDMADRAKGMADKLDTRGDKAGAKAVRARAAVLAELGKLEGPTAGDLWKLGKRGAPSTGGLFKRLFGG